MPQARQKKEVQDLQLKQQSTHSLKVILIEKMQHRQLKQQLPQVLVILMKDAFVSAQASAQASAHANANVASNESCKVDIHIHIGIICVANV
jgi:hypothetical protein